jgi:hypothetical protein
MDGRQGSQKNPGRGRRLGRGGRTLGVVAVLVTCCAAFYGIDWGFLRSEFTSYEVRCGQVVNNHCSQPETAVYFATTYKIFKEQQFVVATEYVKYTKCAIVDRTNWKCTFDDASGSFGARDGAFWETVPEGWAHNFYVPRWKYLLLKNGLIQ